MLKQLIQVASAVRTWLKSPSLTNLNAAVTGGTIPHVTSGKLYLSDGGGALGVLSEAGLYNVGDDTLSVDPTNQYLISGGVNVAAWGLQLLGDASGNPSVGWTARKLYGTDGTTVLFDWSGSNPSINGKRLVSVGTPSSTDDAATKQYVDDAVTGLWDMKGSTDCSSNPNYPAASKGDAYVVSVAGKIGGASGTSVDVGDVYVALADNAGGTQASVGTSWTIIEHNLAGALLSSNNLSDLASASTARTNLGLGGLATVTPGTGVATALAVNVGSTGAVLIKGTSSAADLSNGTSGSGAVVLSTSPTFTTSVTIGSTGAVALEKIFALDDGAGTSGFAIVDKTNLYGSFYGPSSAEGVTVNSSGAITAFNATYYLNYYSTGGVDICNGGGTCTIHGALALGTITVSGTPTFSGAVVFSGGPSFTKTVGGISATFSAGVTVGNNSTIAGNLTLTTAGNGFLVKEGSNATMGAATLSGGTVTVSTTKVTASSRIFLTVQSLGTVTAPKAIAVTGRSAGTSFTITSADATDTSVVAWLIVEPA